MTPIFSRSWLVKTRAVLERLTAPASLRRAWLMSRAWMPTKESPMSPSISALGTRAATESSTTQSTPPERISVSVICRASSPVSGWLTSSSSTFTPQARAYPGSRACSTSMKATMPPRLLCLGQDVLAESGLARGLGAEDLGDSAARDAADAERKVQRDRAGRDDVHRLALGRAETHDRATTELLLDGQNGRVHGLGPVSAGTGGTAVRRSLVRSSPPCSSLQSSSGLAERSPAASARRLALGLFCSRLSLGLPDLDVGRRLQQRLDLGLSGRVLWLLLLFDGGGGLDWPSDAPPRTTGYGWSIHSALHFRCTGPRRLRAIPEVRGGAPRTFRSAVLSGFRP